MNPKLLVIGCGRNAGESLGLGDYIADQAKLKGWNVYRAGIKGNVGIHLDVTDPANVRNVFNDYDFQGVVFAAGINLVDESLHGYSRQMEVNYLGAVNCWYEWHPFTRGVHPFVVISSNSAGIPRSTSAGYCASKAALSQWVRCAARHEMKEYEVNQRVLWGYEPGFIEGTPMSNEVTLGLSGDTPPHRIPGGAGLSPSALASRIAFDINFVYDNGDTSLSGTLHRIDGGEI